MNYIFKNQSSLLWWTRGISVIFEKKSNTIYVSKIEMILLLEVDFNTTKKILFNIRLVITIEKRGDILHEIIGER